MCEGKKEGRISCSVIYNKQIAEDIYELKFSNRKMASEAKPGQFINVYCNGEMLLPRPISICEAEENEGTMKIVYAIAGAGTKLFSKLQKDDFIEVLGPLGNGYSLIEAKESVLVGGGVGTPPLLELAKRLKGKKTIYLGFRSEGYLIEEFKAYGDVYVATDDGSNGHHGNVVELMEKNGVSAEQIYSCGPNPMLKAVQKFAADRNIGIQLSLEERMGCGFGACVGCVCKIKADNESGYTYKKVCKDGPVFPGGEVLL